VGGFNRKWGLPLVQTWAVQAGSVFVFRAQDVDAAHLRAVVASGIGERCAEGFGRIGVNWHTFPTLDWTHIERQVEEQVALCEASKALATQMAQRRLAAELEDGLVTLISGASISPAPQNTQLSRLRNVVRQSLVDGDLAPIDRHLDALKGAKKQFERARVSFQSSQTGGACLLDWLKERIAQQDVHRLLLRGRPLPPVAGVHARLTPELETQYTARLIDGLMKKAIRDNQETGL
jgi:CRISPR-associated protein Csx10